MPMDRVSQSNLVYSDYSGSFSYRSWLFAHAKVLARLVVDDAAGLMTVETRGCNDEIGHVIRQETLTIEAAWISLRQHEGLADCPLGIDVAEIGSRIEAVVAARTQHHPS